MRNRCCVKRWTGRSKGGISMFCMKIATWSRVWALVLFGLAAIAARAAESANGAGRGLTVRDGQVFLEGKPFRGVGANYFSLLSRVLQNPKDGSSLSNLTALAKADIPFVRFMGCGFWPNEQKLYLTNREAFFQRFDLVVRAAEQNHVGLIPSLFWNLPTTPDLVGEPMAELGNPNSQSIAMIRRYTEEVVSRYQDSPAIWAWEFCNEGNLGVDLPNAREHRPHVAPHLGTPATRSEKDELTFAQWQTACVAFAETVRRIDSHRMIISGNSIPRTSAWHNSHEKSWKPDSREQFREVLLRDNPGPVNSICIHLYPAKAYPVGAKTIGEAVALSQEMAKAAHKPLFIGEFGVERKQGEVAEQKAVFNEFLTAMEQQHVPLAAFWVFDLPMQNQDWNVTFTNDRAFMLEMTGRLNARWRGGR